MRSVSFLFLVLLAGACAGNAAPRGPAARENERVTGWMEDMTLVSGKELYLRNNTDRTLVINSVALYQCQNVRGGCGQWDPDVTLEPHEWSRVGTVRPETATRAYYFRWRFGFTGIRRANGEPAVEEIVDPGLLSDFDRFGPAIAAFEAPPDDRYGLTGEYVGRIARSADTLILRVDRAVLRNRLPPGNPVQQLRRIRIGIRPTHRPEVERAVIYGSMFPLTVDLGPGEKMEVGPFDLRVVFGRLGTEDLQLFFAHEILMPDARWTYTFAYVPGTLEEVLGGSRPE